LHALLLAGVVYRALSWPRLWAVVLESTRASAVITIILAGSLLLNYAFTAEGVPQAVAQWVDSLHLQPVAFLLMTNLLFLVLGCFLDVSVLLLVFVPMLLPSVRALGIDLVHFGVLVVLNMMIGLIHPPFGMLLFVTKALTGIPIGEMMREGMDVPRYAGGLAAGDDGVSPDRAVATPCPGLCDPLSDLNRRERQNLSLPYSSVAIGFECGLQSQPPIPRRQIKA